jgi:hypothetical protein
MLHRRSLVRRLTAQAGLVLLALLGLLLAAALAVLSELRKPIFGIPGNHDRWCLESFEPIADAFRETGGRWLTDGTARIAGKPVELVTAAAARAAGSGAQAADGVRRVLLIHDPAELGRLAAEFPLRGGESAYRLPGLGDVTRPCRKKTP